MRKGWGVLLACAVGALIGPPSASADTYQVQLCRQSSSATGFADDFTEAGQPAFAVTRDCAAGGAGIEVHGAAATGTKSLVLTAPGAATITSARLWHHTTGGGSVAVVAVRPGGDTTLTTSSGSSSYATVTPGDGQLLTSLPIGTRGLRYDVTCSVNCPSLDATVWSVELTLDDPDTPNVSFSATAPGGALTVTANAADGTSGVRSARLLVDGIEVDTESVTCAQRISPCPASATLTLSRPGVLSDGPHRVRVEVADASGRVAASESDVVVDTSAPVATGAPSVVGTPEVGSTLQVARGTYAAGQDPSREFRWERCQNGACVEIPGAAGPSYVVQEADQDLQLRVREIASDAGGSTTQVSSLTGTVPAFVPLLVEGLQVGGDERVGGTVRATGGTWRNAVALGYQWRSCGRRDGTDCVDLPGQQRPSLVVDREDGGRYLVLVVTAVGPRGHTRTAQAATGRISALALRNVSQPSVGGTAVPGGRLTAEPGSWEGADVRFAYQWLRCTTSGCLPVSGAVGRVYTPSSKDLNAALQVLVTATDSNRESITVRSASSEKVRSKSSEKALAVPRVRTRVRIVSFRDYQFALAIGPTLQILDLTPGSRVDVVCRLCARNRLVRRSGIKGRSLKVDLGNGGVQIPPGGQIVVRVRKKGTIGREVVGTLSLNRSQRISFGAARCLAKDASLRKVTCPSKAPAKKKSTKPKAKKGTESSTQSTAAPSATRTDATAPGGP
ncbi:hypothetical protein [Conexibacter sp. SYSU D00693]|uniref:hypothetical protein n=1 Tax=Conexibacter sp. SYSU D00693 TaxID=2812560 RepID=UPI00196AAA53|nr:hypothetical protein [Conexibacter sp. SYSU D00693]